jgi:hypothetical protein
MQTSGDARRIPRLHGALGPRGSGFVVFLRGPHLRKRLPGASPSGLVPSEPVASVAQWLLAPDLSRRCGVLRSGTAFWLFCA